MGRGLSGEVGTPAWAQALVRREVDALADRYGIERRTIEVKGKAGPAQPRVQVRMPWHPYAGLDVSTGEYALQPGPSVEHHVRRIARDRFVPHLRLLARDRQMEAAGYPSLMKPGTLHIMIEERIANPGPAWAYVMSPVALAWMREEGRDAEWIVEQGLNNTKNRTHSHANGCDFEIHGDHVARFALDIGRGARWRDDLHQAQITLRDDIPDTLRLGMRHHKGKPLAGVISHPLLDTLPLVMNGMGRFGIAVERLPDETLIPVPAELGQPWNTIDID